MHLELALVRLDELAEGLLVPGPGPDDQIRSHDRILASLLSPGTCVPLTGTDTARTANRALWHRPVFRRAGVNLIESGPGPGGRQSEGSDR